MAQLTASSPATRRSPLEIAIDRVWRFFCSVRAAVYEIAILAVMTLQGTLRGSEVPNWIREALPFTSGFVERWYAYDIFQSLPFSFMLALVSVAIAICTLNRAPAIWRSIANPTITTTRGFLNAAETSASFSGGADEDLTGRVTGALRARRYRVLTETRGDETHVYADRNRFAKLGTFPFHLALILILVGGIVGARYGFREMAFTIPEGSIRDVGRGTGLSVKLEEFSDSYRENAIPIDYRSDLILYADGKEVKRQSIRVNHPMTYGNVIFYQASFGQAAAIRVTDAQGRIVFDDAIPLGPWLSKTNRDAPAGVQDLPQAGYRLNVIAPNIKLDDRPEFDDIKLKPGEMYVQIVPINPLAGNQTVMGAVVGQGDAVTLGDLNVQFLRERRFTVLQVARNPGIPIFWTASFLLVAGLAITFYFPHRRVRAIVRRGAAGQPDSVLMAPLAKRDWSGQRDFFRVIDDLQARLNRPGIVKGRTDQGQSPGSSA